MCYCNAIQLVKHINLAEENPSDARELPAGTSAASAAIVGCNLIPREAEVICLARASRMSVGAARARARVRVRPPGVARCTMLLFLNARQWHILTLLIDHVARTARLLICDVSKCLGVNLKLK